MRHRRQIPPGLIRCRRATERLTVARGPKAKFRSGTLYAAQRVEHDIDQVASRVTALVPAVRLQTVVTTVLIYRLPDEHQGKLKQAT